MHLEITATMPFVVRAGLQSLLVLHISAGGLALGAGGLAMATRKGGCTHRRAGRAFLASMLVMATIGAAVAPFLPQRASVVPALLALYLVATGAMAARRSDGSVGGFEYGACLFAFLSAAVGAGFGLQAQASPSGVLDGAVAANYFIFAAFTGYAGVLDILWIRRRNSATQRIARHLWRMCVALLLAAVSFFLGQQTFLPEVVRGSPALFVPELAIVVLMLGWLVQVRRRSARAPGKAGLPA